MRSLPTSSGPNHFGCHSSSLPRVRIHCMLRQERFEYKYALHINCRWANSRCPSRLDDHPSIHPRSCSPVVWRNREELSKDNTLVACTTLIITYIWPYVDSFAASLSFVPISNVFTRVCPSVSPNTMLKRTLSIMAQTHRLNNNF